MLHSQSLPIKFTPKGFDSLVTDIVATFINHQRLIQKIA